MILTFVDSVQTRSSRMTARSREGANGGLAFLIGSKRLITGDNIMYILFSFESIQDGSHLCVVTTHRPN